MMKKDYFDDLLTAVDVFKNAAGATIMDIRKCLTSLGRRLSPKTVTDGLKRAMRLGFVVSAKRRYYPVSQIARNHIVQSRRGRRGKRGKKGKCPCFSKARYRTASRRRYRRRRRLNRYDSLEARRRRRRSHRRRKSRKMVDVESLQRGDGIVRARRRGKRSARRRRRGRRHYNVEDSDQKEKAVSGNSKQINYSGRPIKVELTDCDVEYTNDQEQETPEETMREYETEDICENEVQREQQNEDRKSGENTEETEENKLENKQSSEENSEDRSETESKSEPDEDEKEDQDVSQNEFDEHKNGYISEEDSVCSFTSDAKDDMETDDYDLDTY